MHVETYEVISADPSRGDNALLDELKSEEALRIIETLGLKGQQGLVVATDEPVALRNPYREMTVIEDRVYRTLLPMRVEVSRYDEGPMPLRVLQVAAHAKDLFPRLEVWFEPGSRDDPLLLGCDDEREWFVKKRHLLARWGEVLRPFEELLELVKPHLRASWAREVTEAIQRRQQFMESLDLQIAAYLAGDSVNVPA